MVKQEAILKKIGFILEELNEQHQYLAQNAQGFNELELDLFLANAKFLADHIEIIKKINVNQPTSNHTVNEKLIIDHQDDHSDEQTENLLLLDAEVAEFRNELPEMKVALDEAVNPNFEEIEEQVFKLDHTPATFEFILNDHAEYQNNEELMQLDNDQFVQDSLSYNENKLYQEEKFDFEEKGVDEIFNRPLSDEEERIIADKKKPSIDYLEEEQAIEEEEEVGPEPFLVVKEEAFTMLEEDLTLKLAPAPPTIVQSDVLVEDPSNKPTLNELLAGKNKSNNTSLEQPILTDLKQGVTLNDKLLYIKELFNGYNLAYAEAIEIANKLPNFEAADNFFQKNYAIKNNWSEKQHTVDQFYRLLNQRFKTPNP